jgi:hypothetical protein
MNCTFGTLKTEVCYECQPGYEFSEDNTECIRLLASEVVTIYLQALGGVAIFVGFLSTFIGKAQNSSWLMIELVQLTLLLYLLSAAVPRSLSQIFNGLRYLTFDLEVLSFLQLPIWEPYILARIKFPQRAGMLHKLGYNTGSALYNCWQLVKAFIVIGALNIYFYPNIAGWLEEAENKVWKWIVKRIVSFVHFSVYIRLVMLGYLFMWVHIWQELIVGEVQKLSYAFCWVMFCFLVIAVLIGPFYALIGRKEYKFQKWGLMRPVYEGMKKWGCMTNLYPTYFLIRRFLLAIIVVGMKETHHYLKTTFFFCFACFTLCFTIVV